MEYSRLQYSIYGTALAIGIWVLGSFAGVMLSPRPMWTNSLLASLLAAAIFSPVFIFLHTEEEPEPEDKTQENIPPEDRVDQPERIVIDKKQNRPESEEDHPTMEMSAADFRGSLWEQDDDEEEKDEQ
jgi:hypothetical protein